MKDNQQINSSIARPHSSGCSSCPGRFFSFFDAAQLMISLPLWLVLPVLLYFFLRSFLFPLAHRVVRRCLEFFLSPLVRLPGPEGFSIGLKGILIKEISIDGAFLDAATAQLPIAVRKISCESATLGLNRLSIVLILTGLAGRLEVRRQGSSSFSDSVVFPRLFHSPVLFSLFSRLCRVEISCSAGIFHVEDRTARSPVSGEAQYSFTQATAQAHFTPHQNNYYRFHVSGFSVFCSDLLAQPSARVSAAPSIPLLAGSEISCEFSMPEGQPPVTACLDICVSSLKIFASTAPLASALAISHSRALAAAFAFPWRSAWTAGWEIPTIRLSWRCNKASLMLSMPGDSGEDRQRFEFSLKEISGFSGVSRSAPSPTAGPSDSSESFSSDRFEVSEAEFLVDPGGPSQRCFAFSKLPKPPDSSEDPQGPPAFQRVSSVSDVSTPCFCSAQRCAAGSLEFKIDRLNAVLANEILADFKRFSVFYSIFPIPSSRVSITFLHSSISIPSVFARFSTRLSFDRLSFADAPPQAEPPDFPLDGTLDGRLSLENFSTARTHQRRASVVRTRKLSDASQRPTRCFIIEFDCLAWEFAEAADFPDAPPSLMIVKDFSPRIFLRAPKSFSSSYSLFDVHMQAPHLSLAISPNFLLFLDSLRFSIAPNRPLEFRLSVPAFSLNWLDFYRPLFSLDFRTFHLVVRRSAALGSAIRFESAAVQGAQFLNGSADSRVSFLSSDLLSFSADFPVSSECLVLEMIAPATVRLRASPDEALALMKILQIVRQFSQPEGFSRQWTWRFQLQMVEFSLCQADSSDFLIVELPRLEFSGRIEENSTAWAGGARALKLLTTSNSGPINIASAQPLSKRVGGDGEDGEDSDGENGEFTAATASQAFLFAFSSSSSASKFSLCFEAVEFLFLVDPLKRLANFFFLLSSAAPPFRSQPLNLSIELASGALSLPSLRSDETEFLFLLQSSAFSAALPVGEFSRNFFFSLDSFIGAAVQPGGAAAVDWLDLKNPAEEKEGEDEKIKWEEFQHFIQSIDDSAPSSRESPNASPLSTGDAATSWIAQKRALLGDGEDFLVNPRRRDSHVSESESFEPSTTRASISAVDSRVWDPNQGPQWSEMPSQPHRLSFPQQLVLGENYSLPALRSAPPTRNGENSEKEERRGSHSPSRRPSLSFLSPPLAVSSSSAQISRQLNEKSRALAIKEKQLAAAQEDLAAQRLQAQAQTEEIRANRRALAALQAENQNLQEALSVLPEGPLEALRTIEALKNSQAALNEALRSLSLEKASAAAQLRALQSEVHWSDEERQRLQQALAFHRQRIEEFLERAEKQRKQQEASAAGLAEARQALRRCRSDLKKANAENQSLIEDRMAWEREKAEILQFHARVEGPQHAELLKALAGTAAAARLHADLTRGIEEKQEILSSVAILQRAFRGKIEENKKLREFAGAAALQGKTWKILMAAEGK